MRISSARKCEVCHIEAITENQVKLLQEEIHLVQESFKFEFTDKKLNLFHMNWLTSFLSISSAWKCLECHNEAITAKQVQLLEEDFHEAQKFIVNYREKVKSVQHPE